MFITANGISYRINIHKHVKSLPYLFLLHGFMGSGKVFNHLLERVAEFANPVTPDLLGHGETQGTEAPDRFSISRQVEDLRLILSRLEHEAVFLHGYSMGGRLALRYALRYPGTLSGLILESADYGIDDEEDREKRITVDEERARAISDDYGAFLKKWSRMALFDNGITVPERLQNRYDEIQSGQNPVYMAASLRGFGAGRLAPVKKQLNHLQIPVLMLAGEQDEKYVTAMSGMESLLTNSRFCCIEHAGHRVHLENAGAFVDKVRTFVTENRDT